MPPGSPARTVTTRTARSCAPRAMPSVRNAICRRVSTCASIIITSPAAPARSASTATCRQRLTWSSMRGATTASAFRVPICRFRSARRTPATSATPIGPSNGQQSLWPAGIQEGGRPPRIMAQLSCRADRSRRCRATARSADPRSLASRRSRGRVLCPCWHPMLRRPRSPRSRRRSAIPTRSSEQRRRAPCPAFRRLASFMRPHLCSAIRFAPCASQQRGHWPGPISWR